MYGFFLGPLQFQSTSQNTHWPQNSNFGCAGFQEKFDTPPLKPTKTETSFTKVNSPPTKLHTLFPTHLQARELCPQTYSLSLLIEWSQVTHTPTSRAYKTEKPAFYNTFARQLCDDTCLPGWLSAFPVHSQTSNVKFGAAVCESEAFPTEVSMFTASFSFMSHILRESHRGLQRMKLWESYGVILLLKTVNFLNW